jgi:outer membrane biosynthesis protein TonB
MNTEKQDRSTWFIYSIALHTILLLAFLITLNDANLLNPQKKPAQIIMMDEKKPLRERFKNKEKQETKPFDQSTFTVPTPVMYYGKELDPDKKPGTPTKQSTPKQTIPEKPQEHPNEKSSVEKTNNSLQENLSSNVLEEEIVEQQPSTIIEAISTITEATAPARGPIKEIIIPKKLRERSMLPKKQSDLLNKTETKKLTLADIFKKSSVVSEDTQVIGEGSGQPVVIKEGDMKYYSVWTKFLHHLNQTAKFNRVKKQVPLKEWIKTGQLKKDLYCGITVTKEGKVLAIDIISSSGFKLFDDTCVHDIWASSPFPPLPESMGKERARFEVRSHL